MIRARVREAASEEETKLLLLASNPPPNWKKSGGNLDCEFTDLTEKAAGHFMTGKNQNKPISISCSTQQEDEGLRLSHNT